MTRHIADNRAGSTGGRIVPFTAIARRMAPEGSHPAALALLRRRATVASSRRTTEYLRIARGRAT